MLKYKAGYKFVDGGVHAQVLDFPAAITCASDLPDALMDVAESFVEEGQMLPRPNDLVNDPEMDIEEPIYLQLHAGTEYIESLTEVAAT